MANIINGLVAISDECNNKSDKYLHINNCGMIRTIPRYNQNLQPDSLGSARVDYKIVYCWEGCMNYTVEGKKYILKTGDVLIHKPGDRIQPIMVDEDSTHYWLHFTGACVKEVLRDSFLNENDYLNVGQISTLGNLFFRIISQLELKSIMGETAANSIFLNILSIISEKSGRSCNNSAEKEGFSDSLIMNAIRAMNVYYDKHYYVEYYAKLCGLSESRFYHLFTETLHISPQKYIESLRIEHAKRKLVNSIDLISTIANEVGYDDALYFTRVFKKNTSMSPTEYRKKFRKK